MFDDTNAAHSAMCEKLENQHSLRAILKRFDCRKFPPGATRCFCAAKTSPRDRLTPNRLLSWRTAF